MNSVQNNELTFQQTAFHPVAHGGEIWLTSSEMAKALGYKKSDAVTQIYSRYQDEFTDTMTTTLKMRVVRKTGEVDVPVRIFSLRGCHLIAMFATTDKAKEFRRWVLDILDREVVQGNVNPAFNFEMYSSSAEAAYENLKVIRQIYREELRPALKQLGYPQTGSLDGRIQDAAAIVNFMRDGLRKGMIH